MKKSSLGHYNYIFQIVWALLGGTLCHLLVPDGDTIYAIEFAA
jgi:hypothetical protein